MKRIPALLIAGMLAVSGWAERAKIEPYSPELVKKAETGDATAQHDLGTCYYFGKGVAKDYIEAVKWFTKSAEQGDSDGQYLLGGCYAVGNGVAKGYIEAVKWYTKSAEQGDERAKKELEKLKSK